jgi:hypothetical protein
MMEDDGESKRGVLPNLENCRTRLLRPLGLVECLVESPGECPYALEFGGDFFCRHPDCLSFAKPRSTNL